MRQHHFTYRPTSRSESVVSIDGRCWADGGHFHVALRGGSFQAILDYVCDEEELYTVGWLVTQTDVQLTVGTYASHEKTDCVNAFLAVLPEDAAKHVRPVLAHWFI